MDESVLYKEHNIGKFHADMTRLRGMLPNFDKMNSYLIFQYLGSDEKSRVWDVFMLYAENGNTAITFDDTTMFQPHPEVDNYLKGVKTISVRRYNQTCIKATFIEEDGWITSSKATNQPIGNSFGSSLGGKNGSSLFYSTIKFERLIPNFVGNERHMPMTGTIRGFAEEYIKTPAKITNYLNCQKKEAPVGYNNASFCFFPFPIEGISNAKEVCMTFSHLNYGEYKKFEGNARRYDGSGNKEWNLGKEGDSYGNITFNNNIVPPPDKKIYTNDSVCKSQMTSKWNVPAEQVVLVKHPREIPKDQGGGYDCSGNEWLPDDAKVDSSLSKPIEDLLNQHKKTFYLLGKKTGELEPKLYLFDLGQVGGVLTYTHIKDAIVYKQVNCKWVQDEPLTQDLKFSSLEGEVDTNFYLLTDDKLDKPSKITTITLRKANEYLLKHFKSCKIARPEGGQDPNDSLKPDFGGGGGGTGGNGGIGGGGFFPETNNPLPNPEVPPCGDVEGGSQTPVSEIILLSIPELTPVYNDTYDFTSKKAQEDFFISRKSFTLRNYSYLRKESAIQVGSHVDNLKCYNYLMYKNKAGKWYYCFIMDKQYINERTARIIIATDVIQTYLFDYVLKPCFVERCHVPRWKDGGKTPTDEFEPEGLEFGEPIQESYAELSYHLSDTYIAVCSNPLGLIPSRQKPKDPPKEKGVDTYEI